ncbi:MAG: hypothetical protein IJD57_04455 [Candidatus Gastranaerophilales bacterium]|nr:hypothetical protein [Candidatus Gastranaerophilales bacterium]
MAGFLLFLFFSICSFIAARTSFKTTAIGKYSIPEKERIRDCIFFIIFGLANLYAAFAFLMGS